MLESIAAAYFNAWDPGARLPTVSECLSSYAVSSSYTLGDCLIAAFADAAYPGINEDLHYLLEIGTDDIVVVLRLFRDGNPWSAVPRASSYARFPGQLLAEPKNPIIRELGFEVCDSHLHSGASLHVEPLLRSLASTRKAPVFKARVSRLPRVAAPKTVPTGGLLLACRWAIRYIWEIAEGASDSDLSGLDQSGLEPDDCYAARSGEYWSGVTDFSDWSRRRRGLRRTFVERGGCPPFASVFWDYLAGGGAASADQRRNFAMGLVWAVWRLSTEVASRQGEGLTRFVDRFTDMGAVRDAALSSVRRSQVLESVKAVASTRDVVGAEFRKSIAASSRQDAKSEIRVSMDEHVRGFIDYLQFSGRSMALSMPVTLLRRYQLDLGQLDSTQELRHAVECAVALSDIVTTSDEALALIHAVDVVGPEVDSQNWPFLVTFEILSSECPNLIRSIHAGESFSHELTGLRKIGELFWNRQSAPHRIGHALALDGQASRAIAKNTIRPISLVDAILDVSWAAQFGVAPTNASLALIQTLVRSTTGFAGISAEDWYQGSALLRTVDGCEAAGVLVRDIGGRRVPSEDELAGLRSVLRGAQLAAHLLARGLHRAANDYYRVAPADMNEYLRFCSAYSSDVRSAVLDLVRESVTIETCPTSNLVLSGMEGYEEHPIWGFADRGVEVTVSTDDPIVFGTSVVDEFLRLMPFDKNGKLETIAAHGVATCSGGVRRSLLYYRDSIRKLPR